MSSCRPVFGTIILDFFLLSPLPLISRTLCSVSGLRIERKNRPIQIVPFFPQIYCSSLIGKQMWAWQWDIRWLEVVNQTLIKSVWTRVVHLLWVQNWPDLGDFPDRSVYHWGCNGTVAHFTPLKLSVALLYFQATASWTALTRLGENFQLQMVSIISCWPRLVRMRELLTR